MLCRVLPLILIIGLSCKDAKRYHPISDGFYQSEGSRQIAQIIAFQNQLNATFKDASKSPLLPKDLKGFTGLDFFKPDTNYVVKARFELNPNPITILMPTTTERLTQEVVYGYAHFSLGDNSYTLELYQNQNQESGENQLFLPFGDLTNGIETYGGGRYIDLEIPKGDSILIDFNQSYNPYCVYNKKYSCPLVPRQNVMKTKVMAGVKMFANKNPQK